MSEVPRAPLTASPETPPLPPRRRRFVGFLVVGALAVAVVVARDRYQHYNHTHIRTDDAYVEGTIFSVASRVPGTVARVNAAVNQRVRAGDVLVELDTDVAREKLGEAEAALQAETLRGGELAAMRDGAGTRIAAAEANLARVLASREELAAAVAVREADVRSRTATVAASSSREARTRARLASAAAIRVPAPARMAASSPPRSDSACSVAPASASLSREISGSSSISTSPA